MFERLGTSIIIFNNVFNKLNFIGGVGPFSVDVGVRFLGA